MRRTRPVLTQAESLEFRRLYAVSGAWTTLASVPAARGLTSDLKLDAFQPLTLARSSMANTLKYAPQEDVAKYGVGRGAGSRLISVPTPDGNFARFRVVESAIMEPALAAKFPGIKTYAGVGIDDPAARIRLDLTPQGFHAQVLTPTGEGAYYVDPYYRRDQSVYASYYSHAANGRTEVDAHHDDVDETIAAPSTRTPRRTTSNGAATVSLRTYRAAVAATGEYTAFHGGTVALGQAAIVTAMNRVSGIYETELAIRLTLVANNNLLVYTNASTDPYTNTSPSALLTENQANIDSIIGTANYDIGHVFSTGGGGLAGLGVVGITGNKARGETGLGAPTGDAFYVDYVAHEMGHQFGGSHTFNTSTDSNRSASNAYEPGSGTTIMAYAGITNDDIQPNSDPYFAWRSIDQILAHCDVTIPAVGTRTATPNAVPTVSVGANYTIPINTPFTLTASGSDPNGDTVYYSWEQADLGTAATLEQGDVGNNPIFRVYNPTTSPSRTFPVLSTILAGLTQTPSPLTVSEGPVESLPTTSRAMKFYPVVRDRRSGAGGTNVTTGTFATVTTVAAANKFEITGFNTATTLAGGGTQTLTWNVAGTTANGINTANVQILMSADGGQTFPTVLAASTPNDGSHAITLPNLSSNQVRFKVAAVGNIFFDINNADVTLTGLPPTKVTNVAIDAGGAQRSRVRTVTVTFDGVIPAANIASGAFSILKTSGMPATYGTDVFSVTNPTGATTAVTLSFSSFGPSTGDGSLGDGRYQLTIDGNKITNASGVKIDALGTGVAGSVGAKTFHRLFGDIDGDAGVSIVDFNAFAPAFGKSAGQTGFNTYFDYDNDNGISIIDFNQFSTRFGVTV